MTNKFNICWGYNLNGQTDIPVYLQGYASMHNLSAGQWHSCAIDVRFSVVCWGNNVNGQLGMHVDKYVRKYNNQNNDDGNDINKRAKRTVHFREIAAGGWHTCAVNVESNANDTGIECWGDNQKGQILVNQ